MRLPDISGRFRVWRQDAAQPDSRMLWILALPHYQLYATENYPMICLSHPEKAAVSICAGCGAGICMECRQKSRRGKNVCSAHCVDLVNEYDDTMRSTLSKWTLSSKITAWFCWLFGGVCLLLAIVAIAVKNYSLMFFLGPCGLTILVSGFWYNKLARQGP